VRDLRRLGLRPGQVVLVHTSLASLGWVAGGAQAVIEALLELLGPAGTLAMPAHTGQLTDPATWRNPPVPAAWHRAIRRAMPEFDPARTPSRHMGAVAELFRTWPGVRRSLHPLGSMTALGPAARRITRHQPLGDPFGPAGPLGALRSLDARILLLGVGWDRCTALHLAERLAWPLAKPEPQGAPMLVAGRRRWVRYTLPPHHSAGFPAAGARLEAAGAARLGPVGAATARLVPLREAVDTTAAWWRGRAHGGAKIA
jgi:aminoglycoside 3-N-acetyltransferase